MLTLPIAIVLAALVPIAIGFSMARPLVEASYQHVATLFNAGLAAQEAGDSVGASEDYAFVLGLRLEPYAKTARYDLGDLQEDARRIGEARALYQSVLRADPGFQLARQHISWLGANDRR